MSLNLGSITTTLEIDRTQFAGDLDAAHRDLQRLDRQAEQSADDIRRSLGRAGEGTRDLRQDTTRAERGLDEMGQAGREAGSDIQRAGREATREVEEIGEAGGRARRGLERMSEGIGNVGQRAGSGLGGGMMDGLTEKISGLAGKAGPIGAALTGVVALGLGAGALLASAIKDGMGQQQESANLQARLGVDDATMKQIGSAAGSAYARAFGESVADNQDIAGQAFDYDILDASSSTKDIQETIEKVTVLNGLLKGETSDTLRGVGALYNAKLVDGPQEAYDVIAKATQMGLNRQGDLINSISEYSIGWKQAGLDVDTVMALIDQSLENGVDNTDRSADAIREFGRRVVEEGDTLKETFTQLGFDGEEMYAKFKKGGPEAAEAFDQVFDAIRAIEDPAERAAAAQALLGDTAGDFIGAFTQWDPSAAVDKYGEITGAAQKASDVMGGTSAAAMESAMRGIETAADGVKLSLAEAFSPLIIDVANWVTAHRGDLIQFFSDLATGAFQFGEVMLNTAETVLNAMADVADVTSVVTAGIANGVASIAEAGASIADALGQDDLASDLRDGAEAARWYADESEKLPSRLRDMADAAGNLAPKLGDVAAGIDEAGTRAADSAKLMQALGETVFDVPDSKTINIASNSPEQAAQLEALGLKVETLPNGAFKITSNTEEGQRIIDNFIATNDGRTITTYTTNEIRDARVASSGGPGAPLQQGPVLMPDGTYRRYGGIDVEKYALGGFGNGNPGRASGFGKMPSMAEIKPEQHRLINWAEPGTGGEAFIPLGPGNRERSKDIWLETGKRLGYSASALGFLAASAFGSDGAFNPGGMSTGNSNIPGVDELMNQAKEAITQNIGMVNYGPVIVDDAALEARLKDAQNQAAQQQAINLGV